MNDQVSRALFTATFINGNRMEAIGVRFNEWMEVDDALCRLCLPSNRKLGLQEVHVWRASLSLDVSRRNRLERLLSPDEMCRAEKFCTQETMDRFIAARGTLRCILAYYLGKDPSALRFRYCPHGKPALSCQSAPDALCFNLSHSEDLALYAITRNQQVGIDVERVVPFANQDDFARRFFSVQEVAKLSGLSREERSRTFFTYWTRKEAYAKAIGLGISMPFDGFDVSMDWLDQPALMPQVSDWSGKSDWYLQDISPSTGFVASMVVGGS